MVGAVASKDNNEHVRWRSRETEGYFPVAIKTHTFFWWELMRAPFILLSRAESNLLTFTILRTTDRFYQPSPSRTGYHLNVVRGSSSLSFR